MNRLVLIHGFTGSPRSYDALAARLQTRLPRLVLHRPALVGHAGAPAVSPRRFDDEVERLARGIKRGGFGGAHLCGYSLGARVALGLLTRYPFLFSGATLIGVHPGLGSIAERAARIGSDERWCQLLARRGMRAFLEAWQAQPLFASQRSLPPGVAAEQSGIRGNQRPDGLCQALRVLGLGQMPDYRGAVRTVPLRVRLISGALDLKFVALAERLARSAPRAELDLVPGVGHNVLIEAPAHVEGALIQALGAA